MIFVILLQPGKDAGMGAALGGGAATTAFGGRGAVTFLGKVTAVSAMAFFLTSLGLSFVGLSTTAASRLAKKLEAEAAAATTKPSTPAEPDAPKAPGSATQGSATDQAAPGVPPPTEQKPNGSDAVPADKLPNP